VQTFPYLSISPYYYLKVRYTLKICGWELTSTDAGRYFVKVFDVASVFRNETRSFDLYILLTSLLIV